MHRSCPGFTASRAYASAVPPLERRSGRGRPNLFGGTRRHRVAPGKLTPPLRGVTPASGRRARRRTRRKEGFDLILLRHGVSTPDLDERPRVARIEREVAHEVRPAFRRGADPAREIPERRRQPAELIGRQSSEIYRWLDDEQRYRAQPVRMLGTSPFADEREGLIDAGHALRIAVERIHERRIEHHAGDVGDRDVALVVVLVRHCAFESRSRRWRTEMATTLSAPRWIAGLSGDVMPTPPSP